MLGSFEETLVVHWILAKRLGDDPSDPSAANGGPIDATQGVIGAPAYMSPEQAEGRSESIGTAADTYSLGATL